MLSDKQLPEVAIVVAVAKNKIIGGDNSLVWKLPADMAHFKSLTMGHPIIMGRKTYQSVGRKLPGRKTIIISRNPAFTAEDCTVVDSLDKAIKSTVGQRLVFICGGGQIYAEALNVADTLYLTEIDMEPSGDTYFSFSPQKWQEIERQDFERDDKNLCNYSFRVLKRRR